MNSQEESGSTPGKGCSPLRNYFWGLHSRSRFLLALIFSWLALSAVWAQAASASSDYSIVHNAFLSGGSRSASTDYEADVSLGEFGGFIQPESALSSFAIWLGHVGQFNRAPIIAGLTNTTITGGSSLVMDFAVDDPETSAESVQVTASSSDSELIPPGNIVVGGDGTARTIEVLAAPGRTGIAVITVRAVDEEGLQSTTEFTITVAAPASKLIPVVTWGAPSPIVYGTPLSSMQLNASSAVPGVLTYIPQAGTILNAGLAQSLNAIFTPADTDTYDTTSVTVPIDVNKAPLTITAVDKFVRQGLAPPALTAVYEGFVNQDTPASLDLPVILNTAATAESPAGTYPITISGAGSPNYTITFVNGTLTVTAKVVPVITWAAPSSITYGTALSGTQLNATADVPGAFSYTPSIGTVLAAGQARALSVTFTPSDTINYESVTRLVAIDVLKAPLTIRAEDKARLYGAELPELTARYTGFVNGESAADLDTPLSLSTTATAASSVGTYPITPGGAAGANYTISLVAGTLSVEPAPLTITAESKTMRQGETVPALTATYTGFVSGDTPDSLTTRPTLTTTATAQSPAETYPITVSGASSPNYTITFVNGTLTVTTKLVPVITWAAPSAITYGTALSGTQLNATAEVPGTFAYTPPIGAVLAAGAAQALAVTFTPADTANYASASASVLINVDPAPLTIAAENKTMRQGEALPVLTATYTGFVSGETPANLATPPTLTATATAESPAGTYPITVSGASSPNYTITFVNGLLVVAPLEATTLAGVAYDGYVAGATAFFDANNNRTREPGEPFALTDDSGRFSLEVSVEEFDRNKDGRIDEADGNIVVSGGIDISTGLALAAALAAPAGSSVVSPLTTLIVAVHEQNPSLSIHQAEAQVAAVLGIPAIVTLTHYDPFAAAANNDPAARAVLNAGAQVQDTLVQVAALVGAASGQSDSGVFQSVISTMAAGVASGSLDLTRTETVQAFIEQSAAAIGTAMNSAASEQAAQLVALGNLVKEQMAAISQNATEAALAISRQQSVSQSMVTAVLTQAGSPEISTADAISLLSEALQLPPESAAAPTGTLSGADDRPGVFGFLRTEFERSRVGSPTAKVTIVRENGSYGNGSVSLAVSRESVPDILEITVQFAHRELSKTIDLWDPLQTHPPLLQLDALDLRLEAIPGAPGASPVPGPGNQATLLLSAPPRWTEQPAGVETFLGGQVILRAVASGSPKPAYQWFKDGIALAGRTGPVLLLENAQATDAGVYHAVASNALGSATSASAELRVAAAPVISSSAPEGVVPPRGTVNLSISALPAAAGTLQWQKNGAPIPGQLSPALVIDPFVDSDAGHYRVVLTSPTGKITSAEFQLEIARPVFSLDAPRRQPDGQFELTVHAPPGHAYALQRSFNLVNWSTVEMISPTEPETVLEDAAEAGAASAFYRLQLLPIFKLSSPARKSDGAAEMVLEAPAGYRFVIEVSDDLVSWTSLQTLVTLSTATRITDPAAAALGFRAYRARIVP